MQTFLIFSLQIFNLNYTQLSIEINDLQFAEILEAELAESNFESFDLKGKVLNAYISDELINKPAIELILEAYQSNIVQFQFNTLQHENWNAVWESNYPPVYIDGRIFIGAPFHAVPEEFKYKILIDPNMSFGTGHHPTTAMVMREMLKLDLNGKRFLDFGCGSAILSVLAANKGASGVGIEIDAHAAEAARLNLVANGISSFNIKTGGVESLDAEQFDFIAANINRNVIQENAESLASSLKINGVMICSGFLISDSELLIHQLELNGLKFESSQTEGEWNMIRVKKLA